MNTEDGAKLYDVCPHVSDSVRWLHSRSLGGGGGGHVSCSSALGSAGGSLGFSAECGGLSWGDQRSRPVLSWKEGLCGRR